NTVPEQGRAVVKQHSSRSLRANSASTRHGDRRRACFPSRQVGHTQRRTRRAGELVTRELGPRSELEVRRGLEAEVTADRWTRLDLLLAWEAGRAEGLVHLRPERDAGRFLCERYFAKGLVPMAEIGRCGGRLPFNGCFIGCLRVEPASTAQLTPTKRILPKIR